MKTFLFGFSLFFLSACATIQQPEIVSFNGVSDFKMSSGKILFTVSADVKNPNGHRFKLFPSQLDVIIDGKKLGQLSNPDKHILKRNLLRHSLARTDGNKFRLT